MRLGIEHGPRSFGSVAKRACNGGSTVREARHDHSSSTQTAWQVLDRCCLGEARTVSACRAFEDGVGRETWRLSTSRAQSFGIAQVSPSSRVVEFIAEIGLFASCYSGCRIALVKLGRSYFGQPSLQSQCKEHVPNAYIGGFAGGVETIFTDMAEAPLVACAACRSMSSRPHRPALSPARASSRLGLQPSSLVTSH